MQWVQKFSGSYMVTFRNNSGAKETILDVMKK